MKLQTTFFALIAATLSTGCATVQYGDKGVQASLQKMSPVPGKTSLYVCREAAGFSGAGNRTTIVVDNQPIGTLKPSNFAHALVEPGSHDVYVKRNPGGNSGALKFASQPGEVVILWVGMTGGGFGVLTVDNFSSRSEAEQCVLNAEYAVRADS